MLFNEEKKFLDIEDEITYSNSYLQIEGNDLLINLYPYIEKAFSNKNLSNKYQMAIKKFIDRNHEALFAIGPLHRIYFKDDDRELLYNIIGISEKKVLEIMKEDKLYVSYSKKWNFMTPFRLMALFVVRYYTIKKMEKEKQNAIMYLVFSFYWSLQVRQFPYPPNENVMNYTINNLSNKYKLKQLGNLYASLDSTAMVCHVKYEDYLIKGTDVLLNVYLDALHTRLSGFLVKITNEYMENYKNGNYLNTEEDNYDEENYHIANNTSFIINNLSLNATTKTLSRGVDNKLVKLSANMCGVSVSVVYNSIQNIIYTKERQIGNLFSMILELYLMNGENSEESIGTTRFIDYCLQIYVKSNTNDKTIIKIKELLDVWLNDCSENYRKTERAATLNNFRKAVYLYFVFTLQQTAVSH